MLKRVLGVQGFLLYFIHMMNSERGFTIVEILVATTMLIALLGAGGYFLYKKNTSSISEEDTAFIPENVEDVDVGSASENVVQDVEEDLELTLSKDTPETTGTSDPTEDSTPETSSDSGSEPVQGTSPFWDNILDNIYTGADSETEGTSAPDPESTPDSDPLEDADAGSATPQITTVTYDARGFSPSVVTINQGEAVLFVNNSNHSMWIGSDSHPTHIGYPEKSSSDCLGSSFDSCVNINPGSSWQFVFNSIGSWGYHNHSKVGKKGTVIVR